MKKSILVVGSLVALGACTSENIAGEGALQLSLTGGVVAREGFPHDEEGFDRPHEFAEGWRLNFEKFIVSMGQVRLTEQPPDSSSEAGMLVASWDGPGVIDLMRPASGVEFATIENIPATRVDVGFDLVGATASAENISASDEDFQMMAQQGYTFYIEGEATKTSTSVRFAIGFSAPTQFRRCSNGKDQTRGIAIEANKTIGASIYPHSTHFWWDVLVEGTPALRFDPWAAVAGGDGVVTAEELASQNLLDLKDENGDPLLDPNTGGQVRYDDGGLLPPDQLDLLSYTIYGFRQSLHFNGLGFCPWTPL